MKDEVGRMIDEECKMKMKMKMKGDEGWRMR